MTVFDSQASSTTQDALIDPSFPVVRQGGTLLTDATYYERAMVLGKITASGKLTLLDKDAVDGSQNPHSVLLCSVDASAEDKPGSVARTGRFNENQLIFAAGTTVDDVRNAMEAVQLWPEPSFPSNPPPTP